MQYYFNNDQSHIREEDEESKAVSENHLNFYPEQDCQSSDSEDPINEHTNYSQNLQPSHTSSKP